jgi:predicted unusual protein kinase regulating ubiquinone biosynthesis (AarF/ABC1/UbiB family)
VSNGRGVDRFRGRARARLSRLGAAWKAALSSDVDVTRDRSAADRAEAGELVRTAGKLRGGVAKIAQLRAYLELEDGLGTEARAQLAQLWDRVPPDPPQAVRAVIEEDLGAPPERLFAAWNDESLAAASLGQVHAARLHDGTEVVVKVQYPGIAVALEEDLSSPSVMRELVGPGLGEGAAKAALDTLRAAVMRELDYIEEAASIERFARAFFGEPGMTLPRPIADRSTRRVLTMTRLPGLPLAAFAAQASEAARARVARTILRFGLGAPLRHGILNGDPHPGNYLVDEHSVGFVDFGFTAELGELAAVDRRLFLALVHRDGEALRYAAHEAGLVSRATVFDHAAWREFERAFGGPFLARGPRRFGAAEAHALARSFTHLVRAGAVTLPAAALVLWRQRMGLLSVLGALGATLDLRLLLCEVLDDGRHPTPLYERYR